MNCARCSQKNFDWAPRCDHCGLVFKSDAPSPDGFAVGRPPVAGEDAADNLLRGPTGTEADVARLVPAAAAVPAVMPSLVVINILVFLSMVLTGVSPLAPTAEALITWGAKYGPDVTHGQWWRLGTSMFVHIGIVHLLMNMYVLFAAGRISERLFGSAGFAALYVLSGLAGSVTSLLWHPNSIGAGASGAIFGLYGGLFGFLMARRGDVSSEALQALGKSGITFVVGNLVVGATNSGIDMAAHLGGLVAGVPFGLALAQRSGTSGLRRLTRAGLVTVTGLAAITAVASQAPVMDDLPAELRRVVALEEKTAGDVKAALAKLGKSMTSEQYWDFVENALLPPWHKERDALAALRLPAGQRDTAAKLARYMTLRGEVWQLSSRAVKEDSVEIGREASQKAEEAASALYAIVPSDAAKAELQRVQTARAEENAQIAVLQRFAEIEKRVVKMFNDGLDSLRAGRRTPRDFASLVNDVVVPLWDSQTRALTRSPGFGKQSDVLKRLTNYVALKRDAFLLTAAGIEKNDVELVKKGEARAAEASQIMRAAKR